MREITRLQRAEQLASWPSCIPRVRLRGVKALGGRYETAVAKQLGPQAQRGIWWSYCDAYGPGLCQTDFVILGEIWAVILECKHTWTEDGMAQLRNYIPVVEMALDKRAVGIQVCKHLVPHHSGEVYNDLESAVMAGRTGCEADNWPRKRRLVTLHWRGLGPMLRDIQLYDHRGENNECVRMRSATA